MAVLKGEGRVPILFGSLPLPVPPNRSAYIARPDVAGEFATVVVAPDEGGVTPSIKALARHLARYGYAVFAPTLRPDFDHAVSDLADAVDSARIPGTEWASADRIAVIGIGSGGTAAAVVAADEELPALALIGSALDGELLAEFIGSLLVLHGGDDAATPADEVRALQGDLGRGEWVIYGGVGGGFFDDASPTHDEGAARDALDRLVEHLDSLFGAIAVR